MRRIPIPNSGLLGGPYICSRGVLGPVRAPLAFEVGDSPIFDSGWRPEQQFIDWAAGNVGDEFEQYAREVWCEAQLKELFLQDVFGPNR